MTALNWLLLAILLPTLAVPAVLLAGARERISLGWLTAAPMGASCFLLVGISSTLEPPHAQVVSQPWIPSLGINLTFLMDGLSMFFGWVICGVGLLVCWYAALYLKGSSRENRRFYAGLLFFVTSMLGTVFSDNLLVLFVFWELTGVASFLLIGFWHEDPEAQRGARQSLVVTASTGLCLLVGIILLGQGSGTYSLSELLAGRARPNGGILALMAIGIFGKSAQFPFHFWLPGAMAAPTPVSAYLHSATMVKLGVFLTARIFPIFGDTVLWLELLGGVGFLTMVVGAFLAFRSNDLKALLAHATISQLGFLIGLYAMSASVGMQAEFYHTLSHVFYKAALFMVVGIVQHSTGLRDLRQLGGLGRLMPLTALAGFLGAAAWAGLPLTTGFISKESALTDLLELVKLHPLLGATFLAATLLAATLNTAVAARFFTGIFLGRRPANLTFHRPARSLELPPALLAAGTLVFGTFPGLLNRPLDWLSGLGPHDKSAGPLALWHGWNGELLLSALVLAVGALLYLTSEHAGWKRAHIPDWLRFDEHFDRGLDGLTHYARRLTHALQADWPPAYLPLLITFLLASAGGIFLSVLDDVNWGGFSWRTHWNVWRGAMAGFTVAAMFGVIFLRRWSAQLIALSVAGFFLTLFFAMYHAPDLAMTQILVESASVVMILLLLARFPSSSQLGLRFEFGWESRHFLRLLLSVGVGLFMGSLVLFADLHRNSEPVGREMLRLSKVAAHGDNGVNTILVDFRGFDTLGEITVLFIAALGGLGLMMRYKRGPRRSNEALPPGFLLGGEEEAP